jgi:F-type H+-transporting ATPase subunit delta
MISSAVFARYARALVDVAMEKQDEPRVTQDLQTYREIFRTVPDLLDVFHSPAVPRDAKQRLLNELIAHYPVGPTTANFLQVVLQHNRFRYFHEIFDYYLRAVNERKGVMAAQITAPAELSDRELADLRKALASATGGAVTLSVRTDPSLLGGLVVQIGSTVYDGSIRRQLAEMRQRLAGRK